MSNGIFSSGKISLIEFSVDKYKQLIGMNIEKIFDFLGDMLVVAISRNGKVIVPHGGSVIEKEDILM